jgi:hypothetical protein
MEQNNKIIEAIQNAVSSSCWILQQAIAVVALSCKLTKLLSLCPQAEANRNCNAIMEKAVEANNKAVEGNNKAIDTCKGIATQNNANVETLKGMAESNKGMQESFLALMKKGKENTDKDEDKENKDGEDARPRKNVAFDAPSEPFEDIDEVPTIETDDENEVEKASNLPPSTPIRRLQASEPPTPLRRSTRKSAKKIGHYGSSN